MIEWGHDDIVHRQGLSVAR